VKSGGDVNISSYNAAALARSDAGTLLREPLAPTRALETFGPLATRPGLPGDTPRVGVIGNPRSRRNQNVALTDKVAPGMLVRAPATQQELVEALATFAAQKIDLLVVDGGDGTVRDVLTAAPAAFGDMVPAVAVIPSGKTNALAIDLGTPTRWSAMDAQAALVAGRVQTRSPVEIVREDGVVLRGFLFGTGAFVRATELAQRTHEIGAFGSLAVGLSLMAALGQTFFGRSNNPWRAGERMRMRDLADGATREGDMYLLLGSTLRRLPLGLKPLGANDRGLNILMVEAPPRLMPLSTPALLAGREGGWLKRAGYHHCHDTPPFQLTLRDGFVLDGETFPAKTITIRTGAPIRFVVP
jgi:hypothetical protein